MTGAPEPDASFVSLRRLHLDADAWVDRAPNWLTGANEVFASLAAHARWEQPDVTIYGETRAQPRLTASWRRDPQIAARVPVIDGMRALLSERYLVDFDSVGLNYYRDGRDSVAWHGDRIPKTIVDPIVAIVSVGEPRPFLLRPRGGGAAHRFLLQPGDLLVMGGTSQRTWQHAVPKVASAGPRISITFRHS